MQTNYNIWQEKKELLFEFCNENERTPKYKEKYKGENIGAWLYHQKSNIKNKNINMKKGIIY